MTPIKKILLVALLGVMKTNAQAPYLVKSGDIFGTRVFVENKGQFDNRAINGERIFYGLDNAPEIMFFTSEGINYEFRKLRMPEKEREFTEEEHREEISAPFVVKVNMRWIGANKDIKVEAYEMQSHYMSYGTARLFSRTFKKIVYKNVYDRIDVEFKIPADKEYGIKYNVIAHPGADLSKFRMVYGGDIKKAKLKNGKVIIETELGEVVEHIPSTTYEGGETLASSYILSHNEITFHLPPNYDKFRKVIIDPWLTTVTNLATNNYAYDVDYDYFDAVYVYGGNQEYKLSKYSPTGSLLWTFPGTLSSPTWSTGLYAGNFTVHKFNRKCYVGQGFDPQNRVIRLDSTGAYDNFITTYDDNFKEVWDMSFHSLNAGQLFVLGGGTSANISAVTIDQVTASMTLSTFQPTNNGAGQDVASHAIDDSGRIWVLYAGSAGLNNMIAKVNLAFNGNDYTVPSTYNTFAEIQCKNGYPGASSLSSNGFNALAVNGDYLYYYDGYNLAAYDKSTGSKLAFTTVNSHTVKAQGGIAVDECNHLYLGGNGNIICYNFDGSTFSPTTSIPLGVTGSTNQYVFDIKLDKPTKSLYVCGSGFVGTYKALYSDSCSASCFSIPSSQTVVPATHTLCAGGAVSVSLANSNFITGLNYQWKSASSTQGPFAVIAGATSTTYTTPTGTTTTYYTGVITCTNTSLTFSTTGVITAYGLPDLQFSSIPATICAGDSAIITVTGASSFTWSTGSQASQIILNPATTNTFNVNGIDSHGCESSSTYTVTAGVCAGINELDNENFVLISPNPARDAVYINGKPKSYAVSFYNIVGQKLLTEKTSSGNIEINISSFPSGIYFIELYRKDKSVFRKKIIISR